MRALKRFFILHGQTILSTIVILTVVIGLLGYRLGSMVPGFSQAEISFINSSSDLSKIIANPLNAPMKLPIWAMLQFGLDTPGWLRAVGASFGVITVLLFYFILRQWHTRRTALLTSFLFIIGSWFLQTSRLALPYILLAFAVSCLIVIARILYDQHASRFKLLVSFLAAGVLVYIPGIIWFIGALIIWQLPHARKLASNIAWWQKLLAVILLGGILTPLMYAGFKSPEILIDLLALPKEFLWVEWIRRLLVLPIFLTAQGPFAPVFNLGRLPLLDVFTTVAALLGIYWYYFKMKLKRTQLFIVMTILSAALITLNGPTFLPLLLPLVYIAVGAGLTLLLQQWFTVFPRNPIARAAGIMTIAIMIAITGSYHLKRYYVAWPGNPDTRSEFIYLLDK